MKNKKLKVMLMLLLIIIAVGIAVYFIWESRTSKEVITEYTPQEEITQEDMRQTFVSLYFKDKQTGQLKTESRVIDAKKLLKEPYKELVTMLIEGPKDEALEAVIPKNTKINSVELKNGVVELDLSKDFIKEVKGKENEEIIIYSIVNTLTELTEVNAVKIKIEGKEGEGFEDKEVNFEKNFVRNVKD